MSLFRKLSEIRPYDLATLRKLLSIPGIDSLSFPEPNNQNIVGVINLRSKPLTVYSISHSSIKEFKNILVFRLYDHQVWQIWLYGIARGKYDYKKLLICKSPDLKSALIHLYLGNYHLVTRTRCVEIVPRWVPF